MGYPQSYTGLEGYDSTKNYPFTLPFPTKITLLHIKKLPFYTTSCVYCCYISLAHQFHQNVLKCLELHQFQVRERERERERVRYDIIEWSMKKNHQAACIQGWCRYCLTFPILLYIAASQKQKLEKKPIYVLWYYKYFPKKIINLFPKIYASRII